MLPMIVKTVEHVLNNSSWMNPHTWELDFNTADSKPWCAKRTAWSIAHTSEIWLPLAQPEAHEHHFPEDIAIKMSSSAPNHQVKCEGLRLRNLASHLLCVQEPK
jgi:hypothetical protein